MAAFNVTGKTLGNYQMLEEVGRGGMAVVSNMDLLIQFREVSGEVWRHRTNLSLFTVKDLWLPLNESTFQWADWSGWQNGKIDLLAIEYYGYFIGHGGLGSGTIYVDDIELR